MPFSTEQKANKNKITAIEKIEVSISMWQKLVKYTTPEATQAKKKSFFLGKRVKLMDISGSLKAMIPQQCKDNSFNFCNFFQCSLTNTQKTQTNNALSELKKHDKYKEGEVGEVYDASQLYQILADCYIYTKGMREEGTF